MQRSAKAPDAPDPLAQGTHQTTVLASRALGRSSDRRRVAEARERQRLGELRPVHPIALRDVPGELLEGQMCARIVALIGKKDLEIASRDGGNLTARAPDEAGAPAQR